ncbi:16S rRNA (adenine(1518)-N(6)/adenine(1519)-N(6))-dimethyltransferase RsmA [Candidatus Kinetoplastidibacterium crithidiae]|uniref:Ribosomal RNA small subunit methyltransferase A n=1 Tax=Candidatus Kinetoplastidibacterium crithidiae TCC036E TaxID=1208918 RepID=M1M5F9_9PROT|nr:16S rRNA (adenine(1518)-N(6)/adenine(1519)-N(6))-dimethyltransferase RsmA [Candidatus Kinetoplastibacterium crithidii]AFZ83129.1 16S rRNA (adenine1518-N6/adenine1519-N6)-dimethyltransferase [Candidatus Kinetoplastibacterium crithidii (ex Angomonas deanei ATCC 30255)]AGF47405.1 dimethyladenosine transferase [Candidatus Kinetoplastibacterium crithidii TCC036E]
MVVHKARKRFGQNFLVDDSVIHNIISTFKPMKHDYVVEIGPGLSAITEPLIHSVNELLCIEIDRDLVKILEHKFSKYKNVRIIESDVLNFDFNTLNIGIRLIGNLPYNISTQLLFKIMEFSDQIIDAHFMLQREVVDRMIAQPSSSDYGRLSVMLQECYEIERLFDIRPDSFNPMPKVFSSFVRIKPLSFNRVRPKNYNIFKQLVTRAFSQKRKILKNSLGEWSKHLDWEALDLNSQIRAENLSVSKFIMISDFLHNKGLM